MLGLLRPFETHSSAFSLNFYGRVIQWLECFVYTEEVGGSSPSSPTICLEVMYELLHPAAILGSIPSVLQ